MLPLYLECIITWNRFPHYRSFEMETIGHHGPVTWSFSVFFAVNLEKTVTSRSLGTLRRSCDATLTHWGRVTHICVGNLTIIGSDNGLSPGRRQAIIWTNAGLLLSGPLGINFSEILIEILTFSFKKMHLKMSSGKWRPSCLGLKVLIHHNRHIQSPPKPESPIHQTYTTYPM